PPRAKEPAKVEAVSISIVPGPMIWSVPAEKLRREMSPPRLTEPAETEAPPATVSRLAAFKTLIDPMTSTEAPLLAVKEPGATEPLALPPMNRLLNRRTVALLRV